MNRLEKHFVPELEEPIRLSDYAGGKFHLIPSRKGMKKAIDKGWVLVNGALAKTSTILSGGETILLEIQESNRPQIELQIEVLFEDEFLAIINKPAGIEVSGNRKRTIENALRFNLKPSSENDALEFPQAIHRLDYPTTGVLVIGKTRNAVSRLNQLFSEGKTDKQYLAVTIGKMPSNGSIDFEIDGKESRTDFEVIRLINSERFGQLNLVDVKLFSGRRHQIRKHFSQLGNPILGDKDYGQEGLILKGKGLHLHAQSISFRHQFTDEQLTVEAPTPKKFSKLFP